jgi:hypothetical protein
MSRNLIILLLYYRHKLLNLIYTLQLTEKRALRRIFGPMREEVTGDGENCIIGSIKMFGKVQFKRSRHKWTGSVDHKWGLTL